MMSDWLTYHLADLILFSSHTYYRLIELYNIAIWPSQMLAIVASCFLLILIWRRPAWHGKALSLILAFSWLWVAWAFHWQRFSTIHWIADYFGMAFVLQAIALIWTGVVKNQLIISPANNVTQSTGLGILIVSLFVQPFMTIFTGHSWKQAELFGIAPDPTVTATIALLLLTRIKKHWWLIIIPFLWCMVSAATLWVLGSITTYIMLAAGLLVIGLPFGRFGKVLSSDSTK